VTSHLIVRIVQTVISLDHLNRDNWYGVDLRHNRVYLSVVILSGKPAALNESVFAH
jgi:hypothetical protein